MLRRVMAFAWIAIIVGVLSLSVVGTRPAYGANGITCGDGFGTKVPVLMVHGFNSNPRMWTKNSAMASVVSEIPGVMVVNPFDYEKYHYNWVTDPNIGPKLAGTIHCLAQNSRKGGGAGKVIVVTHSMGGLVVREAATWAFDGRKIADEIGLVITLAAPNTGSSWANACTAIATALCQTGVGTALHDPILGILMTKDQCLANMALKGLARNSRELQALAPFPSSVPVRAITGNVRVTTQLLFTTATLTTNSDLVVGVDSATAEHTDTGRGDGQFVFGCYTSANMVLARPFGQIPFDVTISQGGCWHNNIYKVPYAQQAVVDGIREYLAATTKAKPKPAPTLASSPTPRASATSASFSLAANSSQLSDQAITLFNRLTIHPGRTWIGTMGEPDVYVPFADQTTCTDATAACPHVFFVDLTSPKASGSYAPDPLKRWSNDPSGCGHAGPVQGPVTTTIGGRSANLYRQGCADDKNAAPRYAWIFPGQIFVALDRVGGSGETVQGALTTAVWQ